VGQQAKLVGTGSVGTAYQGYASALSSDGNTLAIGAFGDNNSIGAVFIFVRSGSTWTQEGSKLVPNDYTLYNTASNIGQSVSISEDGNTVAVGGGLDNRVGAVWIFTRSGTTWSQQGSKLVPNDLNGYSYVGWSVALTGDGNTLAVGGPYDDNYRGAVWIFTRSGTTWSQQGSKLLASGTSGGDYRQGVSLDFSGDGLTLVVGGQNGGGSPNTGGIWVWVYSGGAWSQQGSRLIGTGTTGSQSQQGWSVSISSDGNTIASGGIWDDSLRGAVWVFTRSGTTWSQQGSKLVSTGAGAPGAQGQQGGAVCLSTNGNTLVVGATDDNSVLVYSRSGSTWTQLGSKLTGTGAVGNSQQGSSISLSSDSTTMAVGGKGDDTGKGATWIYYLT
jgi:hypothetical protein